MLVMILNNTVHLGARLAACASYCRKGSSIADIGTDHALLPIYLMQTGTASAAIASDINSEPLSRAKENAERFDMLDRLSLRLGSGLEKIAPGEVDDIVIAGMGGDLISDILAAAEWVKDARYRLILQPMSKPERLRAWLWSNGFEITEETALIDNGRCYSVLLCGYTGENRDATLAQLYCGRVLECTGEAAERYLRTAVHRLEAELTGARAEGRVSDAAALEQNISYITENIHE